MTDNYLPTDYQKFIHTSRYARWLDEEGRRESWPETVSRYIDNVVKPNIDEFTAKDIEESILNLQVMPSMRSVMTAGTAANRENKCMYNCSYLAVDEPKSFAEAMFNTLYDTGFGLPVARQFVSNFN